MNAKLVNSILLGRTLLRFSLLFLATFAGISLSSVVRADDDSSSKLSSFLHKVGIYNSKTGPVHRQYTEADRVRYQLWDYTWKPDPTQPITRIEIRIGEQKVYVYQGDNIAAVSPVTTGKPGHDTPTGHYSIISKDIDHKSNL